MSRPEHIAPPDVFYNDSEAHKYTRNSRIIKIQKDMSQRALELLRLPEDGECCHVLDIGCGSGLSGEVLSETGHIWTGIDISQSMLSVALSRDSEGDLFHSDMGDGLFFRPGTFDAAISISALQWLCQSDRAGHIPHKRLMSFFNSLYGCLTRNAPAVFQLYPETPQHMELITSCAMKAGFSGGLVVDFPDSTRAKKIFLCLFAGAPRALPANLDSAGSGGPVASIYETRRSRHSNQTKPLVKSRDWIMKKKDKARRSGKVVANDSKYTGRKRSVKF
ncbi:hypothetical protein RCL1_008239 [Eukaryota sp. TZLM3-RCL]